MQFTPWDNPMGTDGFEFVEYAAPDPAALGRLFETMGFAAIARHRTKNVTLYRQGEVNFIINAEPNSFAQRFARQHGPSVCAMAFRVKDAKLAYERALELGQRARVVVQGGDVAGRVARVGDAGGRVLVILMRRVGAVDPVEQAEAGLADHDLEIGIALERARELIASARYSEALAELARHEKQFPQSQHAAARNRYAAIARERQAAAEPVKTQ